MQIDNLKIALIHDHLIYFGGAERVLWTLIKMFPQADLYSAFASARVIQKLKHIHQGNIYLSVYNNFPFAQKYPDIYKPLVNLYWESLNLSKYDLVISLSHSFSSKSVITQPQTRHISYIFTPPRYLYTEFNETQIIKKPLLKILLSPLMTILRIQDYIGAQRPDILIACSKTVQKRIRKYYRRESLVIYPPVTLCVAMRAGPPVTLPRKFISNENKEYFLIVSRLVKQKGIDLAIKACNQLKLPLVIIGEGKEETYLKSISGPTVKFLGFIEDKKIPEIYASTKALLYCSKDEDFGLTPVEAMNYGVPVIAFRSGALQEIVKNKVNGLLVNDYTATSLVQTLARFPKLKYDAEKIIEFSKIFSEKTFIKIINRILFYDSEIG